MISSQELVPTTLESSVIKTALAQPSVLPCGNALHLHCFDLICVRVSSQPMGRRKSEGNTSKLLAIKALISAHKRINAGTLETFGTECALPIVGKVTKRQGKKQTTKRKRKI
jgi:hypothetical protein